MGLNPQDDTDDEVDQATQNGVFRATVTSTPQTSGDSGKQHAVAVTPEHSDQELPATVTEAVRGDVSIPPNGSDVLCVIGQNRVAYIVGIIYTTNDDVDSVETGTRQIGHPNSGSTVTLNSNGTVTVTAESGGTVEVASDGTVTINDGSTAPVTDVTTQTDGDGHVTSVSLTRASDLFVPSN